MRRNWLLTGFAAALLVLLTLAWIAGGERPLHPISVPVAVPETRG